MTCDLSNLTSRTYQDSCHANFTDNINTISWLEPLKVAIGLYNNGDDAGCIAQVNIMLTDALPPYMRVRCSILLAYAIDEWHEAEVLDILPSACIVLVTSSLAAAICVDGRIRIQHTEIGHIFEASRHLKEYKLTD